jgi:D-aminoacyl-tRNA deacylase
VRIVLQRVSQAQVSVNGQSVGSIERGYVLLVGFLAGDTEAQVRAMAGKISSVRLFDGKDGKINDQNILQVQGEVLAVSQFTLAGKLEKGNRPDYTAALVPAEAKRLYELFVSELQAMHISVKTGVFGAAMQVSLVNEGPVTLVIDR